MSNMVRTELRAPSKAEATAAGERWARMQGWGYNPSYNVVERDGEWVALCRRYSSC